MSRLRAWCACALVAAALALGGPAAQAFDLKDTQGKVHRLADYRGKWVLVNFWATWCPPCLDEIPDLVALHEAHRNKDLVVIGIAMDYSDPQTVLQFAEQMFISYPIVLGDKAIAAQIGRLTGLPTTYLYGPDGKVAAVQVGPVTKEAIERFIEERAPKRRQDRAAAARAG